MSIEECRDYCMKKKGVSESFPFPNLPNTLVFKVGGKMFVATSINTFASFSIRCNPETVDELRAQYLSVKEPSYFSKKHWSKVEMDGSIPDSILCDFLDTSYNIAISKLPRKLRLELRN